MKTDLTILNTNARSLAPKMTALTDRMEEMEAQIAVVTETWFQDGSALEERQQDLSLGHGLGMVCRNRRANANGVSYGGVAVIWKESLGNFRTFAVKNEESFEVLSCVGTIKGHSRKIVIIACYIPPNYIKARGERAVAYVGDVITETKRRYRDPFIIIGGDFNQWKVEEAVVDFQDLREIGVGPTRGTREIDRFFCNFSRAIRASGTVGPLETEDDEKRSDHKVAYFTCDLPRREAFKWQKYSYRHFNYDSANQFRAWIIMHEWEEVLRAEGSNKKTEAYQRTVTEAVERFFPLKTTKRKSTDLPWINKEVLRMIKDRKELFWQEGGVRTAEWKEAKARTDEKIRERKREYLWTQKGHLLAEDANRNFYRHVKTFNTVEKPKEFDVRDILPGKSDKQVAEELAAYFNKVSQEFEPLQPCEIPRTWNEPLGELMKHEVSTRIRKFRKPKSMVRGDVFPKLMTDLSDFFAIPLTDIYNEIMRSFIWPTCWKEEMVTVIPKKGSPESLGDLRNISCTMLASKIFESYVLDALKDQVKLRSNQYGGVRGVGTEHVLVQLWQEILENSEDYRAGTVITSIDYAKAFNRMSFQECLRALARKGASTPILRLVATFLTNRTMSVRVGETWSEPRSVWGGCPQGSILGVFLFNSTIDDLESGCDDLVDYNQEKEPAETAEDSSTDDQSEGEQHRESNVEVTLSTPKRPLARRLQPGISPIRPLHGLSIGPNSGRVVKRRRRPTRLNISSELAQSIPHEPNHVTEAKWKAKLASFHRFVDDGFSLSMINFENSFGFKVNGVAIRSKHAVQSQNIFRHLVRRAEKIGMKVNTEKTAMVCVSDSLSYEAEAFILDGDGERIGCQKKIKALGMVFGSRPTMDLQVECVVKKMRQRFWTLRNLKKNGFSDEELVKVYTTIIRPVMDYGSVVYHSSLTDEQDELLERQQNQALKCIYGPGISGRRMRDMAGITTLRQRRIEQCDKFAAKCVASDRFSHWFPVKKTRRSTRNNGKTEEYLESRARCSRLFNSPLYYFRRRLNGKEGKNYGLRNAEYRE